MAQRLLSILWQQLSVHPHYRDLYNRPAVELREVVIRKRIPQLCRSITAPNRSVHEPTRQKKERINAGAVRISTRSQNVVFIDAI